MHRKRGSCVTYMIDEGIGQDIVVGGQLGECQPLTCWRRSLEILLAARHD